MKIDAVVMFGLLVFCCIGLGTVVGFGYGRLNQIDRASPALNCNFSANLPTAIKTQMAKDTAP